MLAVIMLTKCRRFLKTLTNTGRGTGNQTSPCRGANVSEGFKRYATKVSPSSLTIQYEAIDLMRNEWELTIDGIARAFCVPPDGVQYFGARANQRKHLYRRIMV